MVNAETASLNGWVPQKGSANELTGADGSPIRCFGTVQADLSIELNQVTKTVHAIKIIIAENLCNELIIGMAILEWLNNLVDPANRCLSFRPKPRNVTALKSELVPAQSQKVNEAQAPDNVVGPVQTVPFNVGDSSSLVANSIDEVSEGRVSWLIINLYNDDKLVKAARPLAYYEVLHNQFETNMLHVNLTMEIGQTHSFVTTRDLNESQLADLSVLLSRNREAFSTNDELGCTDSLEHDIELV